jgi:Nucleotidyl transferase AbiEii toxin, Type IV TA system
MPLRALHRQVAAIALRAAAGHGFALGGGNALIQHGVISRPTRDVDLFTNQETGVPAAAGAVEAALRAAGLRAERQDASAGLDDIFPGMGEGLAEWIITAPGGEQMILQMAYFDRTRESVTTDIGPVLTLEDVIGGKVCALAGRAYERDYLDTAAALERYSPAELIGLARQLDPGLEGRDFATRGSDWTRFPIPRSPSSCSATTRWPSSGNDSPPGPATPRPPTPEPLTTPAPPSQTGASSPAATTPGISGCGTSPIRAALPLWARRFLSPIRSADLLRAALRSRQVDRYGVMRDLFVPPRLSARRALCSITTRS